MNLLARVGLLVMLLLFGALTSDAKLVVRAETPTLTGKKSVVKLTMRNTFAAKIESARATVFLIDDQGKVVGRATQWVIGGKKDRPPLAADATTEYNFVLSAEKPFTRTKVTFTRLALEGGKVVDPQKNVEIEK